MTWLALKMMSHLVGDSINRALASPMENQEIKGLESLERFPLGWSHPSDKKSLQINKLEHVLIAKPHTLWRNML